MAFLGKGTGNSLAEYILPLALVGIVSIPVLISLSGGIRELMDKVFEEGRVETAALSQGGISPGSRAGSAGQGGEPVPANLNAAVPDAAHSGSSIFAFGRFPPNLPEMVETIGANGTTKTLADRISAEARRLLDEGKITPEQASLLENLSNQGHGIARVQRAVEDGLAEAVRRGVDPVEIEISVDGHTSRVPYVLDYFLNQSNGSSGSPQNVLDHAFDCCGHGILDSPNGDLGTIGAYMRSFHELYVQARDSGAMEDPAARAVVQEAVLQIFAVDAALLGSAGTPSSVHEGMASLLTHAHSADICDAGNGQDSGTRCN